MIHYTVGYQPGLMGWMVQTQTQYYANLVQFGLPFESKVAAEIAEFAPRHADTGNLLLAAHTAEGFVGSIVIDGGTTPAARLRWFVVDPRMLKKALTFADQHHAYLWLTTIVELHAARHLYQESGFTLAAEHTDATWGRVMHEQTWERVRRHT
jgi:hypothetical protein